MKTYRIEFAQGAISTLVLLLGVTSLCFTLILAPWGIAILPTLYRIVEE